MAVVHKNVDKIIDANDNELDIASAVTTLSAVNDGTTGLATKASSTDLTDGLATKASSTDLTDGLATKASLTDLNDGLATKASLTDLNDGLATKLAISAQAADSAKLAGQAANYYVAATGLTATTDGTNALGWDGTQFKLAPAADSNITYSTDGSDQVWTFGS